MTAKKIEDVVAAGENGTFVAKNLKALRDWKRLGLVEVNEAVVNPENANEIAVRATEKGVAAAKLASDNQAAELHAAEVEGTAKPVAAKPVFAIEEDVAVPEVTRGGGARPETYPFSALAKGQSFFVPDSHFADKGKSKTAFESLSSTIGAANRRYSEETGEVKQGKNGPIPVLKPVRKFVVRRDAKNGVNGARIFRVL